MDATTDQIKREIEEARERISETTSQLGERIRATFDWRQQVGEHPWAAAGLAAGTGFVLGAMAARAMSGGGRRAAASYGERYAYDRIAKDVQAQSSTSAFGLETAGGRESGAARERPHNGEGVGRSGAVAGLIASLGAALQPQLQEIGRNLAEQLKDLSNHIIGQGKEAVKQKVDEWRSSSGQGGQAGGQGPSGGSRSWSAAPAGAGSATSPGMADTRETRTPQSRETAGGERRVGD